MRGYSLPTSLTVGEVDYPIRSDFRAVLDIIEAASDPELDDAHRAEVLLRILYEDPEAIPPERMEEALIKANEFIDCGQVDDGKPHPRLIDWEQDAPLILPAINGVSHCEIRSLPYLHWWTFFGYFMEVGESQLASVLHIRQKKAKRKKLEKHEQEFYRENKHLIDLREKISDEEKVKKESMMKWL